MTLRCLIVCLGLVSACCATLQGQTNYTPYHFELLATDGTFGTADGVGSNARFYQPMGVAIDAQGNLIIADTSNHAIRKVTPDGRVTTLAGLPGHFGNKDGQGQTARFNKPKGVAIDRVGNIVVADTGNLTVRRISPQGVVTTIAGPGVVPNFVGPTAVAVDRSGNIYVADSLVAQALPPSGIHYYTTIRKITPDGVVTTIAGRVGLVGPGIPPPVVTPKDLLLSYVSSLSLDAAGNLYLADGGELGGVSTVIKTTPAGAVTTIAATHSATGTIELGEMYGLAVDASGNVFLSDRLYHVIRKIAPDGTMTTVAGGSGVRGNVDGAAADARFYTPGGLALDGQGTLFLTDINNNTVRQISANGTVTTLAGHASDSTVLEQFLANSSHLAIDAQGSLFTATSTLILRLTADGTLTTLAGAADQKGSADGPGADARFTNIQNLTVGPDGTLYVIDASAGIIDGTFYAYGANAIRKITSQGVVTTLAGDPAPTGGLGAPSNTGRFIFPRDLAVAADGSVYVADMGKSVIHKVTPDGTVTTLAGAANLAGDSGGTGSAALIWAPYAIACDRLTGNLLVLDDMYRLVSLASLGGTVLQRDSMYRRKITPDGTVTTLAPTTIDNSNISVDTDGNALLISSTTRVDPARPSSGFSATLINRITPSEVSTIVGGSLDDYGLAGGTGAAALFPNTLDTVVAAPDGRIFARVGRYLYVGTPNLAPVARSLISTAATPNNQNVTLTLPADDPDGDPLTYTITDTLGGTATVSGNQALFTPTPGFTGTGYVHFTASDGYATSGTGSVGFTIAAPVTLLSNISTRGRVGAGDNVLIAGFVVNGAADTPKTVLVRAAGPALAGQGVGQPLSRPVITLLQGNTVIGTNQGWGTAGNTADIAATGTAVSAFAFSAGSNDSALLTQILPGAYTAMISGVGGDGVALAEVYDAEPANPAQHPVNISTRGYVGTGENILIAGFIVKGTSPQKFLIRAVGPGLAPFFRPGQSLADPQIDLYAGPTVTNHITGWTNDADMQTAVVQTGAFPLTAGNADAAAIVTLAPGSYTAMVSSRSGGSGIALVEVYQLP
ncbi:MAG: hypothetical protein JSS11_10630 [Verrucomicrobia bacterium]|nr:hypothetical protein [Verrucomicrobiota bacterium]